MPYAASRIPRNAFGLCARTHTIQYHRASHSLQAVFSQWDLNVSRGVEGGSMVYALHISDAGQGGVILEIKGHTVNCGNEPRGHGGRLHSARLRPRAITIIVHRNLTEAFEKNHQVHKGGNVLTAVGVSHPGAFDDTFIY
jgi:hypothetical protein